MGFDNLNWLRDIKGGLSLEGLIQFLQLWDTLLMVEWSMDRDQYLWKHEASSSSSKSAYRAIFYGSIIFEPWKRVWKSWALSKCKVFIWLAIKNKCWTADRLARSGSFTP
jgi:hypothetical protein